MRSTPNAAVSLSSYLLLGLKIWSQVDIRHLFYKADDLRNRVC
jgi:hypothetical protein